MNRSGNWLGWAALILPLTSGFGEAGTVVSLTDQTTSVAGPGALDDAGGTLFAGLTSDPLGSNPRHALQLFRFDAISGAAVQLTSSPRGVAAAVSVSDDGQWLAFVSSSDLAGGNHDLSPELFVIKHDGTGLARLTSDARVNGGSVGAAAMAGNGLRIAFVSNSDPLGTNPAGVEQLFVIDRAGTNLAQLTNATGGGFGALSISDDATRIAFTHSGDLLGTNADRSTELFAVQGDGTGLRQLTSLVGFDVAAAMLAGSGNRIVLQSSGDLLPPGNTAHQDEVFIIDWLGSGLRQLTHSNSLIGSPGALLPSITDDGITIVFMSNHIQGLTNFDGNYEIWRIRNDGTQLRALTTSALNAGCLFPTVSGGGGRVSFYYVGQFSGGNNPDGSPELHTMDGNGGALRQVSFTTLGFQEAAVISGDGSRVVFARGSDLLGGDRELYRVEADGTDLQPITALSSGSAANPAIADDRTTVVFNAASNATGGNPDLSAEIFRINANGTGLIQLTNGATGTTSEQPEIASTGSVVVFESDANLVGANADGSVELFRVLSGGGGLAQITSGSTGTASRSARLDATGDWIVFESNADPLGTNADGGLEAFRIRSDGSGIQQLTAHPTLSSRAPDISGDGRWVVYRSAADPLGGNPEGNVELFLYDTISQTTSQLTAQTIGDVSAHSLSRDGRWVWFASNAPLAEPDPDQPSDLYRIPRAGGAIERVAALRAGLALGSLGALIAGSGAGISLAASGDQAAIVAFGDPVESNPDLLGEVLLIDRTRRGELRVGRALPTVLDWDHESGSLRYDVIRGDVAQLAFGPVGTITLGSVTCLEDDSPDATTAGFGDPALPAPGSAHFYLQRGSAGLSLGPGSWGQGSNGGERIATAGGCGP